MWHLANHWTVEEYRWFYSSSYLYPTASYSHQPAESSIQHHHKFAIEKEIGIIRTIIHHSN